MVARPLNPREPLSVTNLETHGQPISDKKQAEEIAELLNCADAVSTKEKAKGEKAKVEEKSSKSEAGLGRRGFRLKITDEATGQVLNDELVSIVMGVTVSPESTNRAVRGGNIHYSCAPLPQMMTAVKRLEEHIDSIKRDIVQEFCKMNGIDNPLDIFKDKETREND